MKKRRLLKVAQNLTHRPIWSPCRREGKKVLTTAERSCSTRADWFEHDWAAM